MLSEPHRKDTSNKSEAGPDFNQPIVYQVRVRSHLGAGWTDWFEGLSIRLEENGDTLLTGPVTDQAALYGLLKKVRDLGIPLLSLNPIEPCPERSREADEANAPDVEP